MLWALAATPLLLFQILSWSKRIIGGFQGEPLQVSRWLELDVLKSDPTWHFTAAVVVYLIFIAFAALLLWACALQFQRWLFWRRRT
ncbi:hypothetical protein [Blastomonas sp.]|uniref:hypothetical protein n=1 Tax=Blastomonas sp. TaxID=1909299 RepID=UPI00391CF6BD